MAREQFTPEKGLSVEITGAHTAEILTTEGKYLQSYAVIVAARASRRYRINQDTPLIILDIQYWDYSKTTVRHIGQFLNLNAKEIRAKIKSGEIELGELN